MNYPEVLDEFETMRCVAAGASIARYGDGELKVMCGSSYARQTGSLKLATELFNVMNDPAPGCIVGIPTLSPHGPKYLRWIRHKVRFEQVLQREGLWYSSFISRPDSAPWVECQEFLDLMVSCWAGKKVAIVCEPGSKLLPAINQTATSITHICCPSNQAYEQIDLLQQEVLDSKAEVAVLSVGVTATCLANRLAAAGMQALDVGSVGAMLIRLSEAKAA